MPARILSAFVPAAFLFSVAVAAGSEIPQGSHLLLEMVNTVSTKTAQAGDYVYLHTASPVTVDGHIVVPVNSYVQGVVSHARRSGRVSGRAELGIRLETLTLPSGKVVKFAPHLSSVAPGEEAQKVERPEDTVRQAGTKMRDFGTVAIETGTGAAIGGLAVRSWRGAGIGAGVGSAVGVATVLLTRGKEVELRHGETLDVVFDRPVTIE